MEHGGGYRARGKAQERPTTWGWGGEAAEIVTSPELLGKAEAVEHMIVVFPHAIIT